MIPNFGTISLGCTGCWGWFSPRHPGFDSHLLPNNARVDVSHPSQGFFYDAVFPLKITGTTFVHFIDSITNLGMSIRGGSK
jgi:hypothetical protein